MPALGRYREGSWEAALWCRGRAALLHGLSQQRGAQLRAAPGLTQPDPAHPEAASRLL